MLSTLISSVILLLTAGHTLAAPQTTGIILPTVCAVPDYGPFKLFVRRADVDGDLPAKLYTGTKAGVSHMVVDTNTTCVDCGTTPNYWRLKGMELFAVDPLATTVTVNQAVDSGKALSFITGTVSQPSYPFYCSVATGSTTPPVLSAHGTSKLFYMCAFTSVFPPPTKFDIVYEPASIQPAGVHCYPVTLIIQSIGIIPTK